MALAQATLLGCLYLPEIKENHGFIKQTEWTCLHSRQDHWRVGGGLCHISDLPFQGL